MQHDHNFVILEQETIETVRIIERIFPESLDWLNFEINREIRKLLLEEYGKYLDHQGEKNLRERMQKKHAATR